MKKLGLLVIPLMAVSFLASCGGNNKGGGGGGEEPSTTCTVTVGNHNHLSFTTLITRILMA